MKWDYFRTEEENLQELLKPYDVPEKIIHEILTHYRSDIVESWGPDA